MSTVEAASDSKAKGKRTAKRGGPRTRERILAEATRLIAERGYRGTTMKAVAEAVGVTEPAVYRHFPGKAQLLVAVFSENAFEALRPDPDAAGSAIDIVVRQIALLTGPEQATLRRLIAEMYAAAAIEPDVAALADDFVADASARLIEQLQTGIQDGDVSAGLNLEHARAFLHMFMAGLAHHDTLAPGLTGDRDWEAFLSAATRRILNP